MSLLCYCVVEYGCGSGCVLFVMPEWCVCVFDVCVSFLFVWGIVYSFFCVCVFCERVFECASVLGGCAFRNVLLCVYSFLNICEL